MTITSIKIANAMVEQLRAELAKEREKAETRKLALDAAVSSSCVLGAELAAAQATIEQMREALEKALDTRNAEARASSALANAEENFTDSSAESAAYAKAAVAASVAEREARDALLSAPTRSLDALHEARALECERLADAEGVEEGHREWLREEAAAHRARKEGK